MGFDYAYNGQVAVDDTAQIIVGAELTNNGSDDGRLAPMLAAVHATQGEHPQTPSIRSETLFPLALIPSLLPRAGEGRSSVPVRTPSQGANRSAALTPRS